MGGGDGEQKASQVLSGWVQGLEQEVLPRRTLMALRLFDLHQLVLTLKDSELEYFGSQSRDVYKGLAWPPDCTTGMRLLSAISVNNNVFLT